MAHSPPSHNGLGTELLKHKIGVESSDEKKKERIESIDSQQAPLVESTTTSTTTTTTTATANVKTSPTFDRAVRRSSFSAPPPIEHVNIAPFHACVSSLATLKSCDASSVRHASETVQLDSWSLAGFIARVHELLTECGLSTDTQVFFRYEEDEQKIDAVSPNVKNAKKKKRVPDYHESLLDVSSEDEAEAEKENTKPQPLSSPLKRSTKKIQKPKKKSRSSTSSSSTTSSSSCSSEEHNQFPVASSEKMQSGPNSAHTSRTSLDVNTVNNAAAMKLKAERATEQLLPKLTAEDAYRWYDFSVY
jgi:hypothetical protein